MRAARISELGRPPEAAEVDGGDGFEVAAVALNPLDLAIGAGSWYGGHPPLPYVPGCEAVVRRDGERFYVFGEGRGTTRDGFLAERADFPSDIAIPLPPEVDDAAAAAAGIAGLAGYYPVTRVARVEPGDRVLVLGATGAVGKVAVQAAKLAGAGRVVAAGRDQAKLERALELGADATALVDGDFEEEFDVVVDPLWGQPLVRALNAATRNARIVQIGQSAGAEATIASAAVRGKQLRILGHTNFAVPRDELREAYLELVGHVAAARIRIDLETFPLDRVADAWAAQREGRKAVVVF